MSANDSMKTVLVVEDEMHMRIFLVTLLKTNGYKPITAKDGKIGLETAIASKPDLIILDVMMPDEGGAKMYGKLRNHPNLKNTPVIMLSGVGKYTFFHYLNMLNAGLEEKIPLPEAYIEKPPDPDYLLQTIRKFDR